MEHIEGKGTDVVKEMADFLGKMFNDGPIEDEIKPSKFNVGDRVTVVAVKESANQIYGHVTWVCDCPWASVLATRCITLKLHESCGGGDYSAKEYNLEHLD